jgi:hypothetical protein
MTPCFPVVACVCLVLLSGWWSSAFADRYRIDGFVDSTGTSRDWGARPRFSIPGVVVTSETYVKVAYDGRVLDDGSAVLDDAIVLDAFDVVRVQLTGDISNVYIRDRQRIVLEGTFTSEDRNLLRRYALSGTVANVEEAVATRFGLDGVISNVSGEIQLASIRRTDPAPRKTPLPMDIAETIEPEPASEPEGVPGTQTAAGSTTGLLEGGKALLGMVETALTVYMRSDHLNRASGNDSDSLLLVTSTRSDLNLEQSRWTLNNYLALDFGQYVGGEQGRIINRELGTNWTWRVAKADQLSIGGALGKADERAQKDEIIEDFNSATLGAFEQNAFNTYATWQHGRTQDRYRYDVSAAMDSTRGASRDDDALEYGLDQYSVSGTGYWRVKRRVTVLFDTSFRRFSYASGHPDSTEFSLQPGFELITSRRLTARALVGYTSRQSDQGKEGLEDISWSVDMDWKPTRPTTLGLELAREMRDAIQGNGTGSVGEFGIQQYGRVNWQQRWSQRLTSDVSFAYRQLEFSGMDDDQTMQVKLGARYRLSPDLTIRSDGSFTNQRDDFNRWTLTFSADMKL